MEVKTRLLLTTAILVPVFAVVALGACSGGDTETMAGEAQATTTTSLVTTTAMPETTTTKAASTTTTAPSRPITTELPVGATLLDNGNVQVEGYIIAVGAMPGSWQAVHFIPAELVTEEELAGGASETITLSMDDKRQTPYKVSPTVAITVFTLGEGGEQAISLEEFLAFWGPSPPSGGEDLADALWLIEYGEDSVVVRIAEISR